MKLIFATHNSHKLEEIRDILTPATRYTIFGLNEAGQISPIDETGTTIAENALIKARFIWEKFGVPCFSDDTGLEVEALGGAPGVYSARYAGVGCSYQDNVDLLLKGLHGISNRKARFLTVIALIIDGQEHLFEGEVRGDILFANRGKGGFGYDPVFQPEGFFQTFAEMPADLKNSISHRGKAIQKLMAFLATV
ncbi:MAG TPA: non-canonical purine NTP pyrophosphatase, RdgB/HAM1 family [Bacteroidales bacterium]|nr:MAG: non-canonical purine NTP pyrophosphatase, RdgB/HAM1 family [Bacteroidetes bacterium GWE2_42_24]OFY31533.1 MAG: non-canonical purine NTP pyrophosphatase, RdgB/HAM1 family [Bacteroidetes bacterium GWF2_43_11]PKP18825.1 MAG: non-canonical purine NTP pyrophosphatase, RdgB/HAM1 family [Bacteroidetes bacterium HGW-Bacteroidetes-22]HAQ65754.1 non-canonical purine NTP pyrophosphatase, RdgB/HAM1 family [Bacteroidales bacterium]HBZ67217.1 non-canonical purine NTP pyrophosphatase, RdgB/HAM1 family